MIKPCPFCGKTVKIQLTDAEGNFRDGTYLKNPWSGIGYVITHNVEDCLIATEDDNYDTVGHCIFDTRDEAIDAWNKRFNEV